MLVDSAALLRLSTTELNTLMPDHLKQLAKNVSSDFTHLFGDDTQKWKSKIAATNTALQKSSAYHGSS